MTAVRVLTRVLPFLLEAYCDADSGEAIADVDRLFWSTPAADAEAEAGGGAGAGGEETALGPAIVSVAMRLLFARQLTVDVFSSSEPAVVAGASA